MLFFMNASWFTCQNHVKFALLCLSCCKMRLSLPQRMSVAVCVLPNKSWTSLQALIKFTMNSISWEVIPLSYIFRHQQRQCEGLANIWSQSNNGTLIYMASITSLSIVFLSKLRTDLSGGAALWYFFSVISLDFFYLIRNYTIFTCSCTFATNGVPRESKTLKLFQQII
jgi:hypothetical protein